MSERQRVRVPIKLLKIIEGPILSNVANSNILIVDIGPYFPTVYAHK